MNLAQIENNLQQLVQSLNKDSFIYDLLLAYGQPKASITRLQKGGLNLSKISGEIAWKKKLFFKEVNGEDLHDLIDNAAANERAIKHDPRFLIVTDYETLLAVDRKTNDTLDIPISEVAKHFDFFLPWAGMEKHQSKREEEADVKAAVRMAKLYDEIRKDNLISTPEDIHNLNVFLSRLLFCFFAEDTGIFEKTQFTNAVASHTQKDGSDLDNYLDNLFEVMNTEAGGRVNLPAYLDAFPYVNGGLFRHRHRAPAFSRKSRELVIECGSLQWKDIHPDIFGSMIQAVVTPESRGGFGMHYTSVPNILKVIEPLFLIELYDEFETAKHEPRRLIKLLERLGRIKVFDPACGSGNFLIIAYKELRLLEIKILQQLQLLQKAATGFEPKQLELIPKAQLTLAAAYIPTLFSRVELSHFYGIEIDDFAHEIAILSLWLAQHQMNMKFKEVFGSGNPTLPLQAGGNIMLGNATRINWENVCPKSEADEIYITGNPPYLGFNERNKEQKADMEFALSKVGNIQRLDYIGCWFVKASDFIQNSNSRFAFVSTNSICQGEQVSLIWPYIFSNGQEINFAYQPFKWSNNAKGNAGVTCVILGIKKESTDQKFIFSEDRRKSAKNISPYLIEGNPVIITQRTTSLSNLPEMMLGSSGIDGGNLILTPDERNTFIKVNKASEKFIKSFIGGGDFIDGTERYCLWIDDDKIKEAETIQLIKDRIDLCREYRLGAGRDAKKAANVPHRFFYRKHQEKDAIILPMTSSEKRDYLQVGFLTNRAIVSNGVFVIYDAPPFLFGLLSSKIHMCWTKAVTGKLESRIRYSVNLSYNSFPFPNISKELKQHITRAVFRVLEEREVHSEKTLAQLYDPEKMPVGLKEAHHELDVAVERCYRSKPFESDEERLEYLFQQYEQMLAEERQRSGELIFEQPKAKKKRK